MIKRVLGFPQSLSLAFSCNLIILRHVAMLLLPLLPSIPQNKAGFVFTCLKDVSIAKATTYLLSQMEKLNHPYAVAITVYSLAVCLPEETDHSASWEKLTALATRGRSNGNDRPQLLTRITLRLDVYFSNILLASPLSCMCAWNRLERFLICRDKWLLPVDD